MSRQDECRHVSNVSYSVENRLFNQVKDQAASESIYQFKISRFAFTNISVDIRLYVRHVLSVISILLFLRNKTAKRFKYHV